MTLKERKRLIIFSVYFCTNIYKRGKGVDRCKSLFGFPNFKSQVGRWSLNRPPVSCLQSQSAGVLKTHTLQTQFKPTCASFLHFLLWACRIKQIVALKRSIFLTFYKSRNHWMDIFKWSIWVSRWLCTAFLIVFEYLIFSTCQISIANCFSILRHGE